MTSEDLDPPPWDAPADEMRRWAQRQVIRSAGGVNGGDLSAERVEELARTIWAASRADEGTISVTGANIVAAAVAPVVARWLAEETAEAHEWGTIPALANPVVATTGDVKCNEPHVVGGLIVGRCERWVRRGKPHRGKHRIEWDGEQHDG